MKFLDWVYCTWYFIGRLKEPEADFSNKITAAVVVSATCMFLLFFIFNLIDFFYSMDLWGKGGENIRFAEVSISFIIGLFYILNQSRSKRIMKEFDSLDEVERKRRTKIGLFLFFGSIFLGILSLIPAVIDEIERCGWIDTC